MGHEEHPINPLELESSYRRYMSDLGRWLPDGVIDIDLPLLESLGLLNERESESEDLSPSLSFYFHVVESSEKITLFSDSYVIWIVPQILDDVPFTLTLIGVNGKDGLRPEVGFCTSGVFNTSGIVLRLLDHFLEEIQENNALALKLDGA